MTRQELHWMSAYDMAAMIRKKAVSPVELTRTMLERISAVNPAINAYVTVTADLAMHQAKIAEKAVMAGHKLGPIHGVPFSVKDITLTRGVRTTMGSKLMESFIPDEDAVLVARLKDAGGIMLGKTNTSEFTIWPITDNLVFGATRNPWNLQKTPGGSSGGSAAAVAAGMGPLATGNDAGGSVREPASLCGIFGLKPQFGRVPNYPLFHLWENLGHEGTLTRTVRDSALMLDVISGIHWGDRHSLPKPQMPFIKCLKGGIKGMRIAWSPNLGFGVVEDEVLKICEDAAETFTELGAEVEEATPDIMNQEQIYKILINAELAAKFSLMPPFETIKDRMYPSLVSRISAIPKWTATEYLRAGFERQELSARAGKFFAKYELLLCPTLGVPAWAIDSPTPYVNKVAGKSVSQYGWELTVPFNLTGQPAASIPAGWTRNGLPVGLQIVGRAHDETTVLRACAAFEKAKPWMQCKPTYS